VQFQGRGTICFVPHPEGHLVVDAVRRRPGCAKQLPIRRTAGIHSNNGYFFSGCSSAWSECALWTRVVSGSNPLTQTIWKVHYSVGEHTVNVSYVGSSPTFPANFCVASLIAIEHRAFNPADPGSSPGRRTRSNYGRVGQCSGPRWL
jgi:hypothetical protein